ncbi:UDP-N-acetylglucosamine 4,6-dehydratase (inverting) [uncultured Methanobrevibacter sp.]|uniref:UDP-N-acetylglucosamine 4,6-dehydratase (inverting) n=1 Tax=uncultured Methanobrevibacter sp. TaxID=253161 RepID=UPI0025E27972|nr:UDP-N-acetylglucosamine 4,6-dehydratase (inverting) [uncultured Methanobrevibacter sp.]
MLDDKVILITGGTGSFGKKFTERVLKQFNPKKVIIYSRDEYKQYLMQRQFAEHKKILRYFIGDVRDKQRFARACDGVDIIVHAAALKQVPACEYNPLEAIKTNIDGARTIVDVAIDKEVEKVVALSTDKAVNPSNLYGATKMVSDKLFIAANAYVGAKNTKFSVVRYGNVSGSRGSVIPFFKTLIDEGATKLPITDMRMTRFWITLDEAVDLVIKAIDEARGGELFIHKCPSFRVIDLAEAMLPGCELEDVGIRAGEKLHEVMITDEDSRSAYEYDDYYIIYPELEWWSNHEVEGGKKVEDRFFYASDNNEDWLTVEDLREALKDMDIIY